MAVQKIYHCDHCGFQSENPEELWRISLTVCPEKASRRDESREFVGQVCGQCAKEFDFIKPGGFWGELTKKGLGFILGAIRRKGRG